MIVLDTNVVSEAMKPTPDPVVRGWLNKQVADTLYLSSVTLAEILFGIAALPAGRRKDTLAKVFAGVVALFDQRILAFDAEAARNYADLAVRAKDAGKGFPTPDGYIAAIAVAHGFHVASRDVAAFQAFGITVINPWAAV